MEHHGLKLHRVLPAVGELVFHHDLSAGGHQPIHQAPIRGQAPEGRFEIQTGQGVGLVELSPMIRAQDHEQVRVGGPLGQGPIGVGVQGAPPRVVDVRRQDTGAGGPPAGLGASPRPFGREVEAIQQPRGRGPLGRETIRRQGQRPAGLGAVGRPPGLQIGPIARAVEQQGAIELLDHLPHHVGGRLIAVVRGEGAPDGLHVALAIEQGHQGQRGAGHQNLPRLGLGRVHQHRRLLPLVLQRLDLHPPQPGAPRGCVHALIASHGSIHIPACGPEQRRDAAAEPGTKEGSGAKAAPITDRVSVGAASAAGPGARGFFANASPSRPRIR